MLAPDVAESARQRAEQLQGRLGASQEELAAAALARQNQLTQQLQAPPLTPPGVGSPADQLTQQLQTPALEGVSESPTLTQFAADPVTARLAAGIPPDRSFFNGNPNIVFDAPTGRYVPSNPLGGASQEELDAANATLTDDTIPPGGDTVDPLDVDDTMPPGDDTMPPGDDTMPPGGDTIDPRGDTIDPRVDISATDSPAGPDIPPQAGAVWVGADGNRWRNQGDGTMINLETHQILPIPGYIPPNGDGTIPPGGDSVPPGGDSVPPGGDSDILPPSRFTPDQDVRDILTQLLNQVLAQGQISSEQFKGIQAKIEEFLDFSSTTAGEREQITRDLIKQLLGTALPPLQAAIARGDTGLSEEARSALTTRAIEDPARLGERARQDLTSQLLRTGDIVREFGQLAANREGLRSQGLTEIALQDEAQRTLNREQALQAAQITSGLLSTAGGLVDPASFLGASTSAINAALGVLTGQADAQFNALQIASNIAKTRADLDPESLRNIILSALLGGSAGLIAKSFGELGEFIFGDKKPEVDPETGDPIPVPTVIIGTGAGEIEPDPEGPDDKILWDQGIWVGPSAAYNNGVWDRRWSSLPPHVQMQFMSLGLVHPDFQEHLGL
jgi:hypothetical protein